MHKNKWINKLDSALASIRSKGWNYNEPFEKQQVLSMDPDVICDFKLTNCLIAYLKISMFIII